MNQKHLIAGAMILLLGGCSSSKSDSTPDSGIATISDSGAHTGIDSATLVADAGVDHASGTTPGADALHDTGVGLADVGVKLDSTVVVDAPVDAGTAGADSSSPDTQPDTVSATPDAAVDAANPVIPDASTDTTSKPVYDGGLGLSCIKGLFGTYVLRWDGILIDLTTPASPQTVFEASTGSPLTGVVSAQQGRAHGCAALANGTVECWQNDLSTGNLYGQLGNGTTTTATTHYRATPVVTGPSVPLTEVVSMVQGANDYTSCAVTGDGKLWCWGDLTWLVSKGTALNTGYAQAITSDGMTELTGVVSAALGPIQACALTAGTPNTVWCWGNNAHGELGQGDKIDRQYPTKVLGLSNPRQVALAAYYSGATVCVVEGFGVKCWGVNSLGSAGVNLTTDPVLNPTSVVVESGAALDSVVDIQVGYSAFAVLRQNGTIWTWGNNYQRFAANHGQTNVLAIGFAGPPALGGPRFLTSDGVYHNGNSTVNVSCNPL